MTGVKGSSKTNTTRPNVTVDEIDGIVYISWFLSSFSISKNERVLYDLDSRVRSGTFIVKLDREANVVWVARISGSASDFIPVQLVSFSNGDVMGVASFTGNLIKFASASDISNDVMSATKSRGMGSISLFKLDRNGEVQWVQTLDSDHAVTCVSVQGGSDGVYVLGHVVPGTTLQEKTINFSFDAQNPVEVRKVKKTAAFLVKYSLEMTYVWSSILEPTVWSVPLSIAVDSSQNFVYLLASFSDRVTIRNTETKQELTTRSRS